MNYSKGSQNKSKADRMMCFQIVDDMMELSNGADKMQHKSTKASVKNFQMVATVAADDVKDNVRQISKRDVVLQMSRVGKIRNSPEVS